MYNVRPKGTEDQPVTSPSGEALGRNVHVRHPKRIIRSLQPYDPGFGADIQQKNNSVTNIVYMIQDEDLNSNVDTYDMLQLLVEWNAEYSTDSQLEFHMRESYIIKSQSYDPDTPTYME